MPGRVVVVGSSNIDLVCRVPHLPRPGETVGGGTFVTVCGGKGANQAVAAARADTQVTFITRLGDDGHGQMMRSALEHEGIDVVPNEPDPDTPTGTALIMVDHHGENSIAVAPGANHRLLPADLAPLETDIAQASVVLFQMEVPLETVEAGLELAHKHGVSTVVNYAPTVDHPQRIINARVSLLVVNETEARWLAGVAADDQTTDLHRITDALLATGVGAVAVTLGPRGAALATPDTRMSIDPFPVDPIDTTGAGDTFCGALCAQLSRGADLPQALRFACAAGALATTALGAQSAIPSRVSVDRLLNA
ncbi:MAG: ribokinase [Phycisphaerales bacterium JB063]